MRRTHQVAQVVVTHSRTWRLFGREVTLELEVSPVARYVARSMAVIMLVMGLPVLGLLVAQRASAVPYGGCDEAWQAPHSAGARWCRARGWVVMRRLVVSPRAVVRYSSLPHCPWEDGGENQPCSWNFGPGDGNSRGLSYWIGRQDRTHYVWWNNPSSGTTWRWVSREFADVLAEGGYPGADRRFWSVCVTRAIPNGWALRCPDGFRVKRTETTY